MQENARPITYAIGNVGGSVSHLRALRHWIARDARNRGVQARFVFLGNTINRTNARQTLEEIIDIFDEFPGSVLIGGGLEMGLFDFLAGNWNPRPIREWMRYSGGRQIVESFGVDEEMRRSADIRRKILNVSPRLLGLLQGARDRSYEIHGEFCLIHGGGLPERSLFSEETDLLRISTNTITLWQHAFGNTVVHLSGPRSRTRGLRREIKMGASPLVSGQIAALVIENGSASRFLLAKQTADGGHIFVASTPLDEFRSPARSILAPPKRIGAQRSFTSVSRTPSASATSMPFRTLQGS
ncbi:hypothetical protein [Rhizobium leguminosarum]|uniref:hypothetical protein n=1 Tax=Rhizobium leguminosarum TaxID=384 RepID=UPI003F971491